MTARRKFVMLILIIGLFSFWFFKINRHYTELQTAKVPEHFWGATFSTKYTQELSLDVKETYLAMVQDLGVRQLRLPVYWDDVEPRDDEFDFELYDWLILEGEKRGATFILTVGRRAPRWPECHAPDWTTSLPETMVDTEELEAIKVIVDHFKKYDSVTMWQLQNEYFVPWFGNCPIGSEASLIQQIDLVRSIDARPILLTDSGEFSAWHKVARHGDYVGTTLYRVAWNKYLGHIYSAWPAWFYRFKADLNGIEPEKMMVAELQAEPWPDNFGHVKDLNPTEVGDSFSVKQFRTNSEVARRTGFSKAYFWGVEWWYWMKIQGTPEYWDEAKRIFESNAN